MSLHEGSSKSVMLSTSIWATALTVIIKHLDTKAEQNPVFEVDATVISVLSQPALPFWAAAPVGDEVL